MIDSEAAARYPGFAGIEYAHVRRVAFPDFEWRVFEEPSRGRRLERPLAAARVALVGTAGAFLRDQPAFSLGHDGDPSFREIPADAEEICLAHVGYDVRRARRDADVVFPLGLLRELAAGGTIGELAPRHYSFMGYVPKTGPLVSETGPEVARRLRADGVDLVLLVPS
jgi:D-proline reductase (dithiol) PrdB